jgi:hypothetical protein
MPSQKTAGRGRRIARWAARSVCTLAALLWLLSGLAHAYAGHSEPFTRESAGVLVLIACAVVSTTVAW